MRFLIRVLITALAVWLTTLLPLDVSVTGDGDEWWQRALLFVIVGTLITLLNLIVRPIVNALTLPLRILTLGLFGLIVGWFMLWLSAWITTTSLVPWATLEIGGFWKTLLAAVVIAIATAILSAIFPGAKKRD
ncbi:MAG: phage holin family protein [Demequina sp.]